MTQAWHSPHKRTEQSLFKFFCVVTRVRTGIPYNAPPDPNTLNWIAFNVVPGMALSTGSFLDWDLAGAWKHLLVPLLISLHCKQHLRILKQHYKAWRYCC